MKESLELSSVAEHYKKIFTQYFLLPDHQLDHIFSPSQLIIAPLWLETLKKHFTFPPDQDLNYLTILEFISLSVVQHDKIINGGSPDTIKKILLGDSLIVLAIQEINRLSPTKAKIFYEMIKKMYHIKITNHIKQENQSYNFLKFILFLKYYLTESSLLIKKEIDMSYQNLISNLSAQNQTPENKNLNLKTNHDLKEINFLEKELLLFFNNHSSQQQILNEQLRKIS